MKTILNATPSHWRLKVAAIIGVACLALTSSAKADEVKGSTKDINWGQHWAGPKLESPKNLLGKVVLLKIWGG